MPYVWAVAAIATIIFLVDSIAGRLATIVLVVAALGLIFFAHVIRTLNRR